MGYLKTLFQPYNFNKNTDIATVRRKKNGVLIPSRKKEILSSPQRKDGYSLLPSRCQGVLPWREVVSGRAAQLTAPSSTEIKETWICNSSTCVSTTSSLLKYGDSLLGHKEKYNKRGELCIT
jgi:hypothetical protein